MTQTSPMRGSRSGRRAELTPLQLLMAEEADMSADPIDRAPGRRRKGNILVAAQFSLLGLCVLPLGPALGLPPVVRLVGLASLVLGLVVGVLGLLGLGRDTRIHPVPSEATHLHTAGIYGYLRHPMYAAVMLVAIGATLASGRLLAMMATLALAGVLTVKARFEEDLLTEQFGWEYSAYAARVPAVIPRLRRHW